MSQRTALYDAASRAGAVFADEAGWVVPAHYGDAGGEYEAARSGAIIFELSHHGTIQVSGADAATFLHNLCTNDVVQLTPGGGREAFFTTGQGKVVGHATISRVPNENIENNKNLFWVVVAPGRAASLLAHLNHYLVTEQVDLTDRTGRLGPPTRRRSGSASYHRKSLRHND